MSREELKEEEELVEEEAALPSGFIPSIFEGNIEQGVPFGFNTVMIELDGRMQADLNWKKEKKLALDAIEKGYALMWNLQLGLFGELTQPLTHQAQFLSLALSLEHFRDSLWKEFKSQTVGLSLFRGSVDFSRNFRWDAHQEQSLKDWLREECGLEVPTNPFQLRETREGEQWIRIFCRDVAMEYLTLLAARIPDSLPTYLYLDGTPFASHPSLAIQLLNPERFDRLHLAIKGLNLPFNALGWERSAVAGYSGIFSIEPIPQEAIVVGVCIPPMHVHSLQCYEELEEGIRAFQERSISFKLVSESHLTSEWDGLDYLLYSPKGLSIQGKRKLQGFCAAGGILISTSSLLGFPCEQSLKNFSLCQN